MHELVGANDEQRARARPAPRDELRAIVRSPDDEHALCTNATRDPHRALARRQPCDARLGERIVCQDDGVELEHRR